MRAEDYIRKGVPLEDLPRVLADACASVCRIQGPKYANAVAKDLDDAIHRRGAYAHYPLDERGELAQTQMLSAVEAMIEQQELPLDRRNPT